MARMVRGRSGAECGFRPAVALFELSGNYPRSSGRQRQLPLSSDNLGDHRPTPSRPQSRRSVCATRLSRCRVATITWRPRADLDGQVGFRNNIKHRRDLKLASRAPGPDLEFDRPARKRISAKARATRGRHGRCACSRRCGRSVWCLGTSPRNSDHAQRCHTHHKARVGSVGVHNPPVARGRARAELPLW